MTKDRKKIAHIKMCELATDTDDVTNPEHTAGCCGTLSGQLPAATVTKTPQRIQVFSLCLLGFCETIFQLLKQMAVPES